MILTKSFKIVSLVFLILLLIGAGFVIKTKFFKPAGNSTDNYFSTDYGTNTDQAINQPPVNPADPNNESRKGYYVNKLFGMSFSYKDDMTVGSIDEGGSYTVLVQDKEKKGIQILITPFDENIVLTPQRIKSDIPDLVMQELKTVNVGGVSAQAFLNPSGVLGKTREVWFVHNGSLFQIVTSPDFDQTLAGILLTWKFE